MERFAPDEAVIAGPAAREPGREPFIDYLRYIVERTTRQPELTRALIELRLESATPRAVRHKLCRCHPPHPCFSSWTATAWSTGRTTPRPWTGCWTAPAGRCGRCGA
ncbi:hypothetical protein [Actinoplanes sp. NPDC026623]|uniref:hypothetical protein n=1 Tax=Actinoplanes sp. NPDC026623 TaxID=3155610 RepID=UPI003407D162